MIAMYALQPPSPVTTQHSLGVARYCLTPTGLSPVGKRQLRLAHSEDFFVHLIDKQ
jgi:hypothetical protein